MNLTKTQEVPGQHPAQDNGAFLHRRSVPVIAKILIIKTLIA
jgi:hypothetical protein